jgi:acetylglutamate kinase
MGKKKRILIKCGGELLETEDLRFRIAKDVRELRNSGYEIILCHGGGPQISRNMEKAKLEPQFKNGKRVTDADTLHILQSTLLGEISLPFVSSLQRAGVEAIGLHGADCALLEVSPSDHELGFVGKIEKVNTFLLESLLAQDITPLITCIGRDKSGQLYNVNADDVASAVAASLSVQSLVLLSNVDGIYKEFPNPDSRIPHLSKKECEDLLSSSILSTGMIPKVEAAFLAMQRGVPEVRILNGFQENILQKSFSSQDFHFGTTLSFPRENL